MPWIKDVFGALVEWWRPQRADFESVTKQWEALSVGLQARLDAVVKKAQEDRAHLEERIERLEKAEEECRERLRKEANKIAKLERKIAKLGGEEDIA